MNAVNPHISEEWKTTPEVPADAFDFTKVAENSPELIERLYEANNFETTPDLPLILLLIGGSNVGKDVVMGPLIDKRLLSHVKTGTSREMRKTGSRAEQGHEYVWFDRPTAEETLEIEELEKLPVEMRAEDKLPDYIKRMIAKYKLVEWDVHHGNLYGLPQESLQSVFEANPMSIPVVRTESNGARTIQHNLRGIYNTLIVGVIPDSYDQVWRRLREDTDLSHSSAVKRFTDSVAINNALPGLVHFFVHNSENPGRDGLEGKAVASRSLETLLISINGHLKGIYASIK